jgi:IPT/TIG domain
VYAVDADTAFALECEQELMSIPYPGVTYYYYLLHNGKVLKTIEGGNTWVCQTSTAYPLWEVCALDAATAWAVGGDQYNMGIILGTGDGGDRRPDIVSLTPAWGPIGMEVAITGCDFGEEQDTSYVSFGEVEAGEYVSWSEKEIKVRVPEGIPGGLIPVTVTTPEGTSNPIAFKTVPPPTIISIAPDHGMQHTVFMDITAVSGTGFMPGATLRLEKGGNVLNAYNVNVVSSTRITASIGLFGAESGVYDVVVENPDGQEARLPAAFTVDPLCGTGSGAALIMLGLTLGLLSLAGTARMRRRRRRRKSK